MNKQEIIAIVEAMGFELDYDQLDEPMKQWMRFVLKDSLDEPDLRWIWYKDESDTFNMRRGGNILFKAGQKAKLQQINSFIEL